MGPLRALPIPLGGGSGPVNGRESVTSPAAPSQTIRQLDRYLAAIPVFVAYSGDPTGNVVWPTPVGGQRIVDLPFGEALPRICRLPSWLPGVVRARELGGACVRQSQGPWARSTLPLGRLVLMETPRPWESGARK